MNLKIKLLNITILLLSLQTSTHTKPNNRLPFKQAILVTSALITIITSAVILYQLKNNKKKTRLSIDNRPGVLDHSSAHNRQNISITESSAPLGSLNERLLSLEEKYSNNAKSSNITLEEKIVPITPISTENENITLSSPASQRIDSSIIAEINESDKEDGLFMNPFIF